MEKDILIWEIKRYWNIYERFPGCGVKRIWKHSKTAPMLQLKDVYWTFQNIPSGTSHGRPIRPQHHFLKHPKNIPGHHLDIQWMYTRRLWNAFVLIGVSLSWPLCILSVYIEKDFRSESPWIRTRYRLIEHLRNTLSWYSKELQFFTLTRFNLMPSYEIIFKPQLATN